MGTFGQTVPALTRSRALSQGVLVGLTNMAPGASTSAATARTNLGLMNPNDTDTDVDLELRDSGGNVVASRIVTLPAMSSQLVPLSGPSGFFNTVNGDMSNATVDFLSGASIFVFGSVVDNVSGDASFIEADDTSQFSVSGQ